MKEEEQSKSFASLMFSIDTFVLLGISSKQEEEKDVDRVS
jgi:hypothetical protein